MELINLKTLITIVDKGGVKNASHQLGTAQSNITARIRKLEKELDIKIFNIAKRKLELTIAGGILYDYAKKIIEIESTAINSIQQFKGNLLFKVGMSTSFPSIDIPRAINKLKESYPSLIPSITTGSPEVLISKLLDGSIDCALTINPKENNQISSRTIEQDSLVFIKPENPEFNIPFLLHQDDYCYGEKILSWNNKNNNEITIIDSHQNILDCVSAGLGNALIRKKELHKHKKIKNFEIPNTKLKPIDITLKVIFKKNYSREDIISNFTNILIENTERSKT